MIRVQRQVVVRYEKILTAALSRRTGRGGKRAAITNKSHMQ
jgi:hypothetical protein